MYGSDTLRAAILLFHEQLQRVIKEETADGHALTSVLSVLVHLDPFQTMDSGELGFSRITEILNSGYGEERERMAGQVVQSLGRHLFRTKPVSFIGGEPTWIPPLLGFLSLSNKLGPEIPTGYTPLYIPNTTRPPEFTALRILAASPGSADFGPALLPILHSTLLRSSRLDARCLALNVFQGFMSGWFSPKMEEIPSKDLNKLVQAVGNPFEFLEPPLLDGKPVHPPDYDPMMATTILIEFASSHLWRKHLRRSSFASYEEILSTRGGKGTALRCMLYMVLSRHLPQLLSTATKIAVAIKRLEELQCWNTIEVVIMWAWTVGVVNPVDHNSWQLIGRDTLRFYQIHGVERLTALKRHITSEDRFLGERHRMESGVEIFLELPVLKLHQNSTFRYHIYRNLSQVCQLRRLYQLFGYDPTTREEMYKETEVSSGNSVASGDSVAPSAPPMDCDYQRESYLRNMYTRNDARYNLR